MTKFTQRSLCVAIASIGALTAIDAQAVNVSPDGRGQVLLYPYYTTRSDAAGNPYGTLFSVINATGSAKAVRVRFLEGKNSREVLDFNLFLSPFDVWAAAVLPDSDTGGGRVGTTDLSCTLPVFLPTPPAGSFLSFANTSYAGTNDDGAGTGLDRTNEGYLEIVEMATYSPLSVTGKAITHVNGLPPCHQFVPGAGSQLNDAQAALDALPPGGGLFGALTLINVGSGTDYTADAVSLANFYQSGSNYYSSTETQPDLTQATPPVSAIQAPNGRLYESTWAAGTADAVSAVLMHDSIMNEYVLDSATKSGTDWVVTMPTKRYYTRLGAGNAGQLFQRNFNGSVGSCDDLNLHFYDREERVTATNPPLFGGPTVLYQTCWVANIASINFSQTLGSTNVIRGQVQGGPLFGAVDAPFVDGWISMAFLTDVSGAALSVHKLINSNATTISGGGMVPTAGSTTTYVGLPVIGFSLISFTNGTLQVGTPPANVLSNYGGNFVHKTSTTIQ